MEQTTEFVQQNSGSIGITVLAILSIAIIYAVYQYLYPSEDPTFSQLLKGDANARKPIRVSSHVPAIYTGGDMTFSCWIYVDDWNYKVSNYKHVFSIQPSPATPSSVLPLVGLLTPLRNGLAVRANVLNPQGGPAAVPATGSATPDITVKANLDAVLGQKLSMNMFESTVEKPCDIAEVPLQRWVNLTVVVSGRVMDVYLDGKLSRSCVLDNIVNVPRGKLEVVLADQGGFGGRIASVQMWNTQLTPDVIYGIYMMGPTQASHNIFADLTKWLNLNVSFTETSSEAPHITQSLQPNAQALMARY